MAHLRWGLIMFILSATAICGVDVGVRGYRSEAGGLAVWVPSVVAVLAVWCCAIDGRVCRRPIPHGLQLLVLPVSPLAVFAYLTWAHGWKGAVFGFLFAISCVTIYCVTSFGAFVMMHVIS